MLPLTKEKSIDFELHNLLGHDMWVGDPIRIGQVILNLVSNAIKFTPKGKVTLTLFLQDVASNEHVVIEVSDTGIGIDETSIEALFTRFGQADATITRKYGGTGLGLPISRSLVHMMQGQISVDSEVNSGTTIKVSLPLKRAQVLQNEITPVDSSESHLNLTGKHILIAEDNEINQTILQAMLEPTEAILTIVDNGEEAVQSALANRPDLILMDIQMPVKDGVTACLEILEKMPYIPIVALTANVMVEDIDSYLKAGFVAHLGKPLEITLLEKKLEQLMIDN